MNAIKALLLSLFFVGTCLSNNLSNILLIINYNHAHYESVPLLRNVYKKYFKNIVFYGPKEHPEVRLCRHHQGYFSYVCIADAMKHYPEAEGYLFLHDDCILNAWLLNDFDTSKIWVPSIYFIGSDRTGTPIDLTKGNNATRWDWWTTQWGYKPMLTSYQQMPARYKKTLEENWGSRKVVAGFSDILYLPAAYKNQFIELAFMFGKNKAFLETALPTIVSAISLKKDWVFLKGNSTYRSSWKEYKQDVHFNHPIKLSYAENRAFVTKLFNETPE